MTDNSNTKEQELDGMYFLSRTRRMLKRRLLLMLVLGVIGVGVGLGFSLQKQPYYETSLTGTAESMPFNTLANIIEPLNTLLEESSHESFGELLGLSTEQAQMVNSIGITDITESESSASRSSERFIQFSTVFQVETSVFDQSVLPALQTGMLNLLQSNRFHVQKKAFQEASTTRMLNDLDAARDRSDSLRSAMLNLVTSGSSQDVIMGLNAFVTSVDVINEQRYELEKRLTFLDDVMFLNDFHHFNQPTGPHKKISAISGGLIGLLLGFTIVALLELNAVIREEEKRRGVA